MKGVAVLGSTGSIGTQALDVLRGLGPGYRIVGLAAGRNHDRFLRQVHEFRPRFAHCHGIGADDLPRGTAIASPGEWVTAPGVDVVVVATGGSAGLLPAVRALEAGKVVALANKESLVMAGQVVRQAQRRGCGDLRPVDSEHSAIWQCLWGEPPDSIDRLLLTASGGAFRDLPLGELRQVTPEQALRHPTWRMGPKITVDSATLFNKGQEVIEARWLFDVPVERVEVVLHRESIVHSLVEFVDGSVKAQLGMPDMRLPIRLAITYPERTSDTSVPRLDLARVGSLNFGAVDTERFPCLGLAVEAGRRGGTYPAAMAAADEVAVAEFLAGRVGFLDIPRLIEAVLEEHRPASADSLETVFAADRWARERAGALVAARV